MEHYKLLSAIQLPEPTEKELKSFGSEKHGNEHAKSAWRLWQIELLLQDLAFSSPSGFKMNLHFKAVSEGENRQIKRIEANYDRWLFRTS